ncbi:MAG: N-acetyl-gamma-glutamyl-phosphate reductase [Spirochaetota bacterium]
MKVLILGSTGYVGMMLMRILAGHPEVTGIVPVSRGSAGKPVLEVDPGMGTASARLFTATGGRYVTSEEGSASQADVVFSALPHGAAAELIGPYVGSVPVIDLSADFRITDLDRYESVYQTKHPYPELLSHAVYGLTEWHREEIATASIVACPGCYPTATLLPLLPFTDVVEAPAIVNAQSGISGAGRKERQDLLFNERSENMNAYNPGRVHRHVPEIEQELARKASSCSTSEESTAVDSSPEGSSGSSRTADGGALEILFTPHLVPVKQGMIVTTVARLHTPLTQQEAEERLREAYADSPFVGLSPRGIPQSRDVRNTNRCDLGVAVHEGHLQLFSSLDNLYKGASGQGVQNMNVRMGLDETLGLRTSGEF